MFEIGPVRTHMFRRRSLDHSATSLAIISRFCHAKRPCASPRPLNMDGILPTFPVSALPWSTLTSGEAGTHGSRLAPRPSTRSKWVHSSRVAPKLISLLLEVPAHGERVPSITMQVRRPVFNRPVARELQAPVRDLHHAPGQQERGE